MNERTIRCPICEQDVVSTDFSKLYDFPTNRALCNSCKKRHDDPKYKNTKYNPSAASYSTPSLITINEFRIKRKGGQALKARTIQELRKSAEAPAETFGGPYMNGSREAMHFLARDILDSEGIKYNATDPVQFVESYWETRLERRVIAHAYRPEGGYKFCHLVELAERGPLDRHSNYREGWCSGMIAEAGSILRAEGIKYNEYHDPDPYATCAAMEAREDAPYDPDSVPACYRRSVPLAWYWWHWLRYIFRAKEERKEGR